MVKVPHEEAERNKKRLAEILKHPDNKDCADCISRGPTWCAINWGIFVCITCSGIHRKLGVHISKVKSCTLDNWITKDLVSKVGNRLGNQLYEYKLPATIQKPREQDDIREIEEFIRKKYERKLWMKPGAEEGAILFSNGGKPLQDEETVSTSSNSVTTTPSTPSNNNNISFGNNNNSQHLKGSKSTPSFTQSTVSQSNDSLIDFGMPSQSTMTSSNSQTMHHAYSTNHLPMSHQQQQQSHQQQQHYQQQQQQQQYQQQQQQQSSKDNILAMFDQPKTNVPPNMMGRGQPPMGPYPYNNNMMMGRGMPTAPYPQQPQQQPYPNMMGRGMPSGPYPYSTAPPNMMGRGYPQYPPQQGYAPYPQQQQQQPLPQQYPPPQQYPHY